MRADSLLHHNARAWFVPLHSCVVCVHACLNLDRFVPRHADELYLETDDPVLMVSQSEDLWCQGYNMRTGSTGIFPTYYAVRVSKEPSQRESLAPQNPYRSLSKIHNGQPPLVHKGAPLQKHNRLPQRIHNWQPPLDTQRSTTSETQQTVTSDTLHINTSDIRTDHFLRYTTDSIRYTTNHQLRYTTDHPSSGWYLEGILSFHVLYLLSSVSFPCFFFYSSIYCQLLLTLGWIGSRCGSWVLFRSRSTRETMCSVRQCRRYTAGWTFFI